MNVPARTRIKMCGLTSEAEIALAVDAGADAVGFILAESQRRVELAALPELVYAVPPYVDAIAVVANQGVRECGLAVALGLRLQFSGNELPEYCEAASPRQYLKVFHIQSTTTYEDADFQELEQYVRALWMFDSTVGGKLGGTGVSFAWDVVAAVARRRPIVISGGLTPENVAACVRTVRPYAVDVRSGVETDGRKDIVKMRAFVRAVREADAQT
ncbi:MAG: phosphoribosylanthranilate isomerase [Vulcanimicrobiaceae bacterium]